MTATVTDRSGIDASTRGISSYGLIHSHIFCNAWELQAAKGDRDDCIPLLNCERSYEQWLHR